MWGLSPAPRASQPARGQQRPEMFDEESKEVQVKVPTPRVMTATMAAITHEGCQLRPHVSRPWVPKTAVIPERVRGGAWGTPMAPEPHPSHHILPLPVTLGSPPYPSLGAPCFLMHPHLYPGRAPLAGGSERSPEDTNSPKLTPPPPCGPCSVAPSLTTPQGARGSRREGRCLGTTVVVVFSGMGTHMLMYAKYPADQ